MGDITPSQSKSHIPHTNTRHLLCPIPSCNEIFADKDLLTKHLEMDHSKVDPSSQLAPKRVYAGKYNCYFEGCNDYFDDAEVSFETEGIHVIWCVKNFCILTRKLSKKTHLIKLVGRSHPREKKSFSVSM